ncbi:BQ2448_248 [Microbotryum intermedium]|uniref:BQ2448_248 protein n=1 Tax=Microbotryum intermedium TaxID=269621 RepID=A0A238F524_9BASI|nr:BQ2448_248 [Microbotryum intermedium]
MAMTKKMRLSTQDYGFDGGDDSMPTSILLRDFYEDGNREPAECDHDDDDRQPSAAPRPAAARVADLVVVDDHAQLEVQAQPQHHPQLPGPFRAAWEPFIELMQLQTRFLIPAISFLAIYYTIRFLYSDPEEWHVPANQRLDGPKSEPVDAIVRSSGTM